MSELLHELRYMTAKLTWITEHTHSVTEQKFEENGRTTDTFTEGITSKENVWCDTKISRKREGTVTYSAGHWISPDIDYITHVSEKNFENPRSAGMTITRELVIAYDVLRTMVEEKGGTMTYQEKDILREERG